jgi:hypothetical protein
MSKEAMKLALEALEECRRDPRLKYEHPTYDKAIKALEEALAKQEQDGNVCARCGGIVFDPVIKQEQGEPVEWGVDWGKDGNSVSIIKRLADGSIEVLAWEYAPHPQQRTWVGLTDNHRTAAIWSDGGFGAGALWAEKQLSENNK